MTPAAPFAILRLPNTPGAKPMSAPDKWSVRIYALPCTECSKISHKSFIQLETEDRLPCDHCGVSIKVTDYYGFDELDAIAKGLGSVGHILRKRKKGD
jgi:hypothetical protein